MTSPTIGYATLQIIPSLDGVSEAVTKQLGGLKAEGRSAGKAIGDGIASGVDAAAAKVEQASKKVETARNREADAAGKLKTAEAQLEALRDKGVTDLGRLTAAEEKAAKAKRDHETASKSLTRSAKAEETAIDKLTAAQKRLADASDDAEGKVGGLFSKLKGAGSSASSAGADAASGFLEGMGGPLAELGAKTGPIGTAILAAGALGIGGGVLLGQNIMAGVEREVGRDRLQAQLGLTDSQAASFGQSTGEIYAANFGESAGDVGQAFADVASTLGAGAAPEILEDLTRKALTFRDVFGTDVTESIATAQSLIANGLAPDTTAAFDAMVTAYQRVPAAMRDELPDVLTEYSTFTDSLGFSMDEVFGLIVKNAPKGQIAIDKIGDALKEFTLLATDVGAKPVQDALEGLGLNGGDVANNLLAGGEQASQQFDEIVDGLLRIPDAGEQAQSALALFGTPLEDLDKAKIPEFLAGLDDAETAMNGFSGSSQAMVDTFGDNTAGSIESAKRSIELSLADVQNSLADAFGPWLTELAGEVTDNKDVITDAFVGIADTSITFAEVGIRSIGLFSEGLGQLVAPIGDVLGAGADFQAWTEEIAGNDDRAAELREEAQGYYSMGEGMTAFGRSIKDVDLSEMHDMLAGIGDEAKGTDEGLNLFGDSVTGAGDKADTAAGQVSALNEALKQNANLPLFGGGAFTPTPGSADPNRPIFGNSGLTGAPATGIDRFGISGFDWDAVADKESSNRWNDNNSGGHSTSSGAPRGGLQITDGTWSSYGGREFAPTAADATKQEQIAVAERIAFSGYNGTEPQGLGAWEVITQGKVPGVTASTPRPAAGGANIPLDLSGANNVSGVADATPGIQQLAAIIAERFPGVNLGGVRPSDGPNTPTGHQRGVALDIGIQDQAVGDAINEFIRANPEDLGVKSTIWRDQWKDFKGNQSTVGGHQDHVHVEVDGGSIGYQPSAADLNTAGYEPGIGTPGYDEDGQPGTYEVDPKDVREAQQRIDDQFERVREADESARQAQAAIGELEADADQAEIDAAVERKRKADYDAQVARRELDDLKGELGEAQKGKFSPAKEPPKSAKSSRGSGAPGLSLPGSFSGIGSALGEFAGGQIGSALDVFGVGDSPGWLQGITTFLGGIGVSDSAGNSLFDGGNLFGGGGQGTPWTPPQPGLETEHGRRGGQQPGPGVVYNIQARDTEDAFVRAQRQERERAAAKLQRF